MQFKLMIIACFLFAANGFSQKAKLILPTGHGDSINSVEYSNNGKLIVTASDDKKVMVWNAENEHLLNNFTGHESEVTTAKFSFDGQRVLSFSEDDEYAILWDVVEDKRIKKIEKQDVALLHAEFNNDGSKIAAVYEDGTLCIYDGFTGILLNSAHIKGGVSEQVVFSRDGNFVLTIAEDGKTASVWSVSSNRLSVKIVLKDPVPEMSSGYFSSDGKDIITLNDDGTYRIWNLSHSSDVPPIMGKDIASIFYLPDSTGFITVSKNYIIEVFHIIRTTGGPGQIVSFKKLNTKREQVSSIEISKDGKMIGVGFLKNVVLWDLSNSDTTPVKIINTGVFIKGFSINRERTSLVVITKDYATSAVVLGIDDSKVKLALEARINLSENLSFSRDSSRIVTHNSDGKARIWDAFTGRLIWVLSSGTIINNAEFSPDGKSVITAHNKGYVIIWDVLSGKTLYTIRGASNKNKEIATFNSDGSKIIMVSKDSSVQVYKFDPSEKKWGFIKGLKRNSPVKTAFFSRDEHAFFIISIKGEMTCLNTVSWDLNWKLKRGHVAEFSPDRRIIVTDNVQKPGAKIGIELWDAWTGQLLNTIPTPLFDSVARVKFSPDGRFLVCISFNNIVRIFDAVSLNMVSECKDVPSDFVAYDVNFSSDNQKLVFALTDNTARVWDVKTGVVKYILTGHTSDVTEAIFSPDNKTILTTSRDLFVKRWDASNGELLYSFVPVDDNDFLVLDKYERWDGTPSARNLLYVTCGSEDIQLEQFENLGWEPDLVSKVMGINKNPIRAKQISEIPTLCNYTPLVYQNGLQNGVYKFTIVPRSGGLGKLSLKINDKLLRVYTKSQLTKANDGYHLTVNQSEIEPFLSSNDKNQLLVIATTSDGAVTSRGGEGEGIVVAPAPKRNILPNLYLIAIGVNEYGSSNMKLNFASSDAIKFASTLSASARNLLNTDGKDHVKTMVFSSNNRASADWPAKTAIQNKLISIAQTAGPDDILVIFFAGHGTSLVDDVNKDQNNYYLLTADNASFDMHGNEKQNAISTQELEFWMRSIKAQKQVLIMDACHSGQGLQNLQALVSKRGDVPADQSKAIEQLKDNTGTFILAASSSSQQASELEEYQQGVLTYSLLSGIKNQDALSQNKFIDVSKWFNSAKSFVADLAVQNKQINQNPEILGKGAYTVGMVDKAVLDGIKLISKKKVMAHANFYVSDGSFLDPLLFTNELDRAFNEESAKVNECPFVFVSDNSSPEAFSVKGVYETKGNNIIVKASLIQGQTVIKQFTTPGDANKKSALAKKVVDEVVTHLKNNNK